MNKPYDIPPAFNLYKFQLKALPVLSAWGLASFIAGLVWLPNREAWRAGFGTQFAAWGLIDAFIALLGQRAAARNHSRWQRGEIDKQEQQRQAAQFERLLWLNAGLDICYVLGGKWLVSRQPQDARRQGMGWGIMVQGGVLFIWDVILGILVHNRGRGNKP